MILALTGFGAASYAAGPIKSSSAASERRGGGATTIRGDCTDGDGDGYGTAGSSGCPNAGVDCNDGNDTIHPGATEMCNSVDDDCDGSTDEGFTAFTRDFDQDSPTFQQFTDVPLCGACAEGAGICARAGIVACASDTEAQCNAVPGDPDPAGEGVGGPGDATCFDLVDNDCNGITDQGNPCSCDTSPPTSDCNGVCNTACNEPEKCDGVDNDGNGQIDDGLGLFQPCTVGVGACQNAGAIVCDGMGGTKCSANPLPASTENTPGAGRCTDGADNDCDGATDLDDTGCQEAEKCDGVDNDGDGAIDNGFDVGDACSNGLGPCLGFGTKVCSADALTTVCNAVPQNSSPEGPLGATCSDNADNDCDGLVDEDDPNCAVATELTASCSLPYLRGRPGQDCTGWHTIGFDSDGGPTRQTTAELLALDVDGNTIDSTFVNDGERAHLASRISEEDYKFTTRENPQGVWHEDFSPVPMLRVTVQDEFSRTEAYCSNIPFLQVIQPSGGVVSASASNVTPVLVAIPLVDVTTLSIKVDGVDIVAEMGLDPATAFPGGPYSDTITLNGASVTVQELIVDGGSIDVPHSNTVKFNLLDLGCGEHIILVEGQSLSPEFQMVLRSLGLTAEDEAFFAALEAEYPGIDLLMTPLSASTLVTVVGDDAGVTDDALVVNPQSVTDDCHVDDLRDIGASTVFKIEITEPSEGDVTAGGATTVVGNVCHGKELLAVDVNGCEVDVTAQVIIPGDGESSGSQVTLDFMLSVPETDLRTAVDNGETDCSFDRGPNHLIAEATDVDFNTTYDGLFFAVGPITPAADGARSTDAPDQPTRGGCDPVPASPSEVTRAFVLAINEAGLDVFFTSLKDRNEPDIKDRVADNIRNAPREPFHPDIPDSCDPPTHTTITNTGYAPGTNPIDLDFQQDEIGVSINLPDIDIYAHFEGYCESDCFLGICAVCTTIDLDARIKRENMKVTFDVTEQSVCTSTPLGLNFDPGTTDPADAITISGEVDIGCLLGFFLDVVDFFVSVVTFGQVDLDLSSIDFTINGDDLKDRMGALDGDPLDVKFAKFRNDDLPEFGTRQRDSRISDVAITPTGIAVAIGASFEPEPDELDPEAADIQGTAAKNAPIPQPPIVAFDGEPAGHVTIAISSDVFNQLFFSMVRTGRLKTSFETVRELGNFLPDACGSIADEERQAFCVGFNCQNFTPLGRCEDCEDTYGLGQLALRQKCRRGARIGENANIRPDTNLILQGKVEVPPALLIDDDPTTDPVETVLRYQNITITMIADRDGNGMFDASDANDVGMCELNLDQDLSTPVFTATECVLWRLCMSIDVNLSMELTENPNTGRSRIKFNFLGIDRELSQGLLCDGSIDVPELDIFNESAFNDTDGGREIFDLLEDRLKDNTPPLDSEGLELGGFVTFERDRVIAIETQPMAQDDGFQDFIGITGNIVADPDGRAAPERWSPTSPFRPGAEVDRTSDAPATAETPALAPAPAKDTESIREQSTGSGSATSACGAGAAMVFAAMFALLSLRACLVHRRRRGF